jgi:processive 1,2-diacylglycerol beta-glucosyltransferase
MKVLILSISKRSGHQHAAQALEKAFHLYAPQHEIINQNFFEFIKNPLLEEMLNTTYMGILKTTPELWDYLYDNDKFVVRISRLRNLIIKQASNKFKEILEDVKPDVIVSTQAFPCEVSCSLKKEGILNIPIMAIVTDYIAHAYWVHPEVDLYTVPSKFSKEDLALHGINPSKIKILGIPVNPEFEITYTEEQKKDIRRKFGIDPDLPAVLLMGGSQGLGPFEDIVKELRKVTLPLQLIVITGHNTKLRRSLSMLKEELNFPVHIFGFVNNVHEFMSISQILITKPGGVTSSEALVKDLPMIIVHPLPGQEENNSQYLVKEKAAIRIDFEEDVPAVINNLLGESSPINELIKNIQKIVIHDSGRNIVNSIINLADEKSLADENNRAQESSSEVESPC